MSLSNSSYSFNSQLLSQQYLSILSGCSASLSTYIDVTRTSSLPNGSFLKESQGCTQNVTELIDKLQNASQTTVSITNPRCLILTDNGLLVTLSHDKGLLLEYNATDLTISRELKLSIENPYNLAYHDGFYYIGYDSTDILVVNSAAFIETNSISSPHIHAVRDIIFLKGGETMVVVSSWRNSLLFFGSVNSSKTNYTFLFNQSVTYDHPHGLLYINDTFFYATSWTSRTIYSYSAVNSTFWKETLFINASSVPIYKSGGHVMLDEDGNFWFVLGSAGFYIFDHQGDPIGSYKPSQTSRVFDGIFAENYVLYVSNWSPHEIIRIDPNIH